MSPVALGRVAANRTLDLRPAVVEYLQTGTTTHRGSAEASVVFGCVASREEPHE
jgi:hypothetical protein